MKETISSNKQFPYLILDDYYTKEELNLVWKEIDFLHSREFKETSAEHVARKNGKELGKSQRFYIEETYQNRAFSNILTLEKKYQNEDFSKFLKKGLEDRYHHFRVTNKSVCLISYYENNDYYDSHFDVGSYTMLTWLYKEPKNFTGGDLIFTQFDTTINCINNRTVLFPSYYYHQVTKINYKDKKIKNHGRYCITTFFHNIPH